MFKFVRISFYSILSSYGFFVHSALSSDALCENIEGCSQALFKNLGGEIQEKFSDNMNFHINVSHVVDLSEQPVTYEELKQVQRNLNVRELYLQNSNINNKGLEIISTMRLRSLDIANNVFDDDGIPSLSGITNLETLDITRNKVTGKGIKSLENLQELKDLKANYTYLANKGVEILSHFTQLEHLAVRACGFDDTALPYFLMMPNLKTLDIVGNTNLTRLGVDDFLSKKKASLNVKHDF